MRKLESVRRREVHMQWAAYQRNPKSLTPLDLLALQAEAKKLGITLTKTILRKAQDVIR